MEIINLPPYATSSDLETGKLIVSKILKDNGIKIENDDMLVQKTVQLMKIMYGTGADYSEEMFLEYGKTLFSKQSQNRNRCSSSKRRYRTCPEAKGYTNI